MRIRTVKPEFWSHPVMARLPDDVQLLSIALLNYADDEGYFLADPQLVKSACQPFRDEYGIIQVRLQYLSDRGWISLCFHPEQGAIGKIEKFRQNQVINHPKPSKIKNYWVNEAYRMSPVGVPERYYQELILDQEKIRIRKEKTSPIFENQQNLKIDQPEVQKVEQVDVHRETIEVTEKRNGVDANHRPLLEKSDGENMGAVGAGVESIIPPPETKKAKAVKHFAQDGYEYLAAKAFAEDFLAGWVTSAKPPTEAVLQSWASDVDKMLRLDGRTADDLNDLLNWIDKSKPAKSGFTWQKNILSMGTLRDRWNEGKFEEFAEQQARAKGLVAR